MLDVIECLHDVSAWSNSHSYWNVNYLVLFTLRFIKNLINTFDAANSKKLCLLKMLETLQLQTEEQLMNFNEQNLDSAGSLAECYSASRFFQFTFSEMANDWISNLSMIVLQNEDWSEVDIYFESYCDIVCSLASRMPIYMR